MNLRLINLSFSFGIQNSGGNWIFNSPIGSLKWYPSPLKHHQEKNNHFSPGNCPPPLLGKMELTTLGALFQELGKSGGGEQEEDDSDFCFSNLQRQGLPMRGKVSDQ